MPRGFLGNGRFLMDDVPLYALPPNTVELLPTLGALFPRGGPVPRGFEREIEFFIDNLLVRIHIIIVMI